MVLKVNDNSPSFKLNSMASSQNNEQSILEEIRSWEKVFELDKAVSEKAEDQFTQIYNKLSALE